jgi:hypothetical protein
VQDLSFVTGQSNSLAITLLGGDDGQPSPPSLTHRVTSLPTVGTLTDDGTGLVIDAVPHDLNGGGSVVTYTPPAGYQGLDAFAYTADDGGIPPDGGAPPAASVGIVVGDSATLLEFLVDDGNPGWATTGEWAFGQPMGGGSHDGDPTSGATGANVYGYNLAGDYADGMGQEILTSAAVDLGGKFATAFEFQRWLGVEDATFDHATVQISTDGASWTTLWDHTATSAISDTSWSLQSFDISSIADGESSVSFRWIMGTTDGTLTYPGWNIDDVRIGGVDSTLTTPCTFEPGEVPSLRFTDDTETLVWLPARYVGGTNLYDLIRSEDPDDFRRQQSGATCIVSNSPDTVGVDTVVPAVGQVFFYRVRPENECDEGPLGGGQTGLDC